MSTKAKSTFAIKSWDEKPYDEFDGGRKLTHAHVIFTYTGDMEAEGKIEYVMAYSTDGSAHYVGLERIVGKVGDRSGSFVIRHIGHYSGKDTQEEWNIVEGSGTGELEGISGKGMADSSSQEDAHTFTLAYDLAKV